MRVQVYWNLHKMCWSVVALEGENKGRVIDYASYVTIRDATLVVQPAGQARVRLEGRKNVHAFVRGEVALLPLKEEGESRPTRTYGRIRYNPYRDACFMQDLMPDERVDGIPVLPVNWAARVDLEPGAIAWAYKAEWR